uniref:Apple domain-containing protein n=1 Tax=Rhabditophanes sp. KR3021 TaxID=114890 RepID=A0AC35TUE8_9BILA
MSFQFYFLLLVGLLVEANKEKFFVIEFNELYAGKVLQYFLTNDFNYCLEKCKKVDNCDGVNFAFGITNENSIDNYDHSLPIKGSIIYSATSYLADSKTRNCLWTYEKTSGIKLQDESMQIEITQIKTKTKCLNSCSERVDCQAAFFNQKTSECKLSKISFQTLQHVKNYFENDVEWDIYESGCKKSVDTTKCSFLRFTNAGVPGRFINKITNIEDADKCEEKCVKMNSHFCRSYTYNKVTKECSLSHRLTKTIGENIYSLQNSDLEAGEINNCMDIKIKCLAKGVLLAFESPQIFSGNVSTRSKTFEPECDFFIDGKYNFQTFYNYDKCGFNKNMTRGFIYKNDLIIKDGNTNFITAKDKFIYLTCKISDNYEHVNSASVMVGTSIIIEHSNKTRSETSFPTPAKPRYLLKVTDLDGNPLDKIVKSKNILIEIRSKDFFEVSDLRLTQPEYNVTKQIINENGLFLLNGSKGKIVKTGKGILKIELNLENVFNRIDAPQSELVIDAYIRGCSQFNCGNNRQRRNLGHQNSDNSRFIELEQEIYYVKYMGKLWVINNSTSIYDYPRHQQNETFKVAAISIGVLMLITFVIIALFAAYLYGRVSLNFFK